MTICSYCPLQYNTVGIEVFSAWVPDLQEMAMHNIMCSFFFGQQRPGESIASSERVVTGAQWDVFIIVKR